MLRNATSKMRIMPRVLAVLATVLLGIAVLATTALAETRLGDVNARFIAYPNASEGGNLSGNNLTLDPAKDSAGVRVRVGIDLSISGSDPAKPGELEVLIPRSIFEVRDNSKTKVEFPFAADGSGDWKYSFVDENGDPVYENSSACKYIKLVNNVTINHSSTQSMEFEYYTEYASDIVDGSNVDFEPKVTLTKGTQTTSKTGTKLNVQVDTHVKIANAAKSQGKSFAGWNSAWGDAPSLPGDINDYFFHMWNVSAYLEWDSATQPYKLTYSELSPVPDGGIVCGYMDWYNNNSGTYGRDNSIDSKALLSDPPEKTVMRAQDASSSWYSGILVAYKKPTTLPKEYTNTFTAKITPYDGKDTPSTVDGTGNFTYKEISLNIPEGEMYYLEKIKGWTTNGPLYRREHGGIDRILAGVPVDNLAYGISGYAYQYTKDEHGTPSDTSDDTIKSWGAEYTAELIDDMLFLNVDADHRLGSGDYEITRINPQWEAYEYHQDLTSGSYVEVEADYSDPNVDYPELVAWGRSADGANTEANWTKIATFEINSEGRPVIKEIHLDAATAYNSETLRGGVKIPKGTGFTQIKYSVTANKGKTTEDNQGIIRVRFERRGTPGGQFVGHATTNKSELYLTLYPTDLVKRLVQNAVDDNVKSDPPAEWPLYDGSGGEGDDYAPVAKLHNIDMLAVYVGKDAQGDLSKLRGAFVGGESDTNFQSVLLKHDQAIFGTSVITPTHTMWHKKAQVELAPYLYDSAIGKKSTYENDPANNRVIVHYESKALEAAITHDTDIPQELIDRGVIRIQQGGTFYDLLPQGMTVDPASIKASACAADAPVEVEYETIANYKDSGRTLLIVRAHTDVPNWKQASTWPDGFTYGQGSSVLNHLESGFTITYDGYYDWDSMADYGNTVTNYIGYESENDKIEHGIDDDAHRWTYTDMSPVADYMTDLDETPPITDEDGNPIERPNFIYTNDSNTLSVVTQARYGLDKKITGPTVSSWVNGRVIDGENSQVGVPTGGQYQYRLRYSSEPGTVVKNMVLFDNLEGYSYIRDKKVVDGQTLSEDPKSDEIDVDRDDYKVVTWTGTFESIDVAKVVSAGAKADIYYTTKARKDQKVDDQSDKTDTLVDGQMASCWNGPYTAADINALGDETKATITGIAIDMRKKPNGQEFELDSTKSVTAIITMRAPSDPAQVRELVNKAQEQYDNALDADKSITNEKPYAYNSINMNGQVKQKGAANYSEEHIITHEYTRAYLYVPKGNISIAKRITGMEEEEAVKNSFKVKATVTLPDGSTKAFSGKYYRIDTTTGYYYTDESVTPPYTDSEGIYHAKGVFVNMSSSDVDPYYVMWDETGGDEGTGAWVTCDAEGNASNTQVAADADKYTFETTDGQDSISIKGNQRIVLTDCDADLEWTVEELAESAQGFRTSHMLNGKDGEDDYIAGPFVIGDKNTARVIYRNMSTSELVVEKQVDVGDEDRPFEFTITITDKNGDEYLDWEGNPMVFDYVGEAEEGSGVDAPADGTLKSGDTISLKHGQRVRIYVPAGAKYKVEEASYTNYEDPSIEREYTSLVVEGEGDDATTTTQTETSESNGTGSLTAPGDSAKEIFTNTHVPDEQPKKTVEGNDVDNDKIELPDGTAQAASEDQTNEDTTHVDLGDYANPVVYTLSTDIPIETKKIVIADTLVDALEFVSTPEEIVVLDAQGNNILDNEDLSVEVEISGQKLTATIQFKEPIITDEEGNEIGVRNNLDEILGGSVSVIFVAQLKEGADLAPYTTSGTTLVPNTTTVSFNDRPEVESEPVTITPPTPDEEIEKRVMGKEHYDLSASDEVYNYTIDVLVPPDAENITITDTLEPVLEFVKGSEVVVTYQGEKIPYTSEKRSGQTLTLVLDGEDAIAQRTRTITVRFLARVKAGANLKPYMVNGNPLIPNTASYMINNDAKRVFKSNTVTVTPPPESKRGKIRKPLPFTGDIASSLLFGVSAVGALSAYVGLRRRLKEVSES